MLNLVFIAGPGWPENQIENHATTIQLHIRAFRYQIERVFVFYYSIFFSKRHRILILPSTRKQEAKEKRSGQSDI